MTGYGPQESWLEENRLLFFASLEEEITKAELNGCSIFIEMDAKSKLGSEFIPKDPYGQSAYGKILGNILKTHNLSVVNGTAKSEGLITRKRETEDGIEESVIDFVIVSADLVENINKLKVDEERLHVLTRITKTKKKTVIKESDHNSLITDMNLKWKIRSFQKAGDVQSDEQGLSGKV